MKHLFWWVVTIVGCIWLSCQELPAQDMKFEPPSTYAMYWYEVENCMGVYKDFRAVTFYSQAPDDGQSGFACATFVIWVYKYCWGQYIRGDNAILLIRTMLDKEWLVKHEMIHALGIMEHPREVFLTCSGREP